MRNQQDKGASADADRATAVEPVPVSPLRDGIPSAALETLREWLGLAAADSERASAALRCALKMGDAFTGQVLIEREFKQQLDGGHGWEGLCRLPVRSLTGGDAFEIDASGKAWVRSPEPCEVHYRAGMAPDWEGLPGDIRHGIIRLAAHQYRSEGDAEVVPPATVAALWRPWRRMALSAVPKGCAQ